MSTTMDTRDIEELLSRGLDADLDRDEMRRLYRLAASSDEARRLMGEMAELETGLRELAELSEAPMPAFDVTSRVMAEVRKPRPTPATEPAPAKAPAGEGLLDGLWHWLRSPGGVSFQPLSLAVGAVSVALLFWVSTPVLTKYVTPETPRLAVHDVQFASADARVDWTYRYIVAPGAANGLKVNVQGNQPVHLQFEAEEPVDLMVEHRSPDSRRSVTQSVRVHGIGYATLREPRSGDEVTVRNLGQAPVLVYAHTLGQGGSEVRKLPVSYQ